MAIFATKDWGVAFNSGVARRRHACIGALCRLRVALESRSPLLGTAAEFGTCSKLTLDAQSTSQQIDRGRVNAISRNFFDVAQR